MTSDCQVPLGWWVSKRRSDDLRRFLGFAVMTFVVEDASDSGC